LQHLTPSRTAMATALIRSHHTRCDPLPLFSDPWGDILVPQDFKDRLIERAAAEQEGEHRIDRDVVLDNYLRAIPSYAAVVLRSRYAEDELDRAVRSGVRQYVSVGAGLDSFCLRRPRYASDVHLFEVDHPATQDFKRQRLADNGIAEPALTYFVAADLAQESLATVLRRSPFRFGERSFFSWLGVTIYLSREANSASLQAFAECGAAGSLLVFTYTDERAFDASSESEDFRRMRSNAERVGEPFITGFRPAGMSEYLGSVGLEMLEDLDGARLAERYPRPPSSALEPSRYSHVVLARCPM
jgi:methyltransferase (TIGR00027 family)